MKITCETCQTKYTIANQKVVGKKVKIKCKKCGNAIVVHGEDEGLQESAGHDPNGAQQGDDSDEAETRLMPEGAAALAAASGNDWTVNAAEGDERTMTTAQLASEYARGALSDDTYVWKEGMSDWLPIANVPELKQYMAGHRVGAPAAAAAAPAPAGRPASSPPGAPTATPLAAASSPAARRGGRGAGVDVFSAAETADPGAVAAAAAAERLVGERNENSVLFSLSALTTVESAAAAKPSKDDGLFDMRGSAASKNNGRAGIDDLMNLGGTGIAGPMLAPPPLLAPVIEEPPPPPVAPVAVPVAASPPLIQEPPQKKSRTGLIAGIVVGVVAVGGIVYSLSNKPDATTDASATTAQSSQAETAAPRPNETAAAAADTSAESAAAAPSAEPTAEPNAAAAANAVRATTGSPKPLSAGDKAAAVKDKPAAKPPEAAPAPAPANKPAPAAEAPSGSGQDFDRGAAMAALRSAAGAAKSCKKPDGPTGGGKVKVTFAPSGNVTSAQVEGPPFAGTPVGGCVASAFRGARVPPFAGAPVSVSWSFSIN